MSSCLLLLQVTADVGAIHTGQLLIQQKKVGQIICVIQQVIAIGNNLHLIACCFKNHFKNVANARIVVCNYYFLHNYIPLV